MTFALPAVRRFSLSSSLAFWGCALADAGLLIITAVAAHRFVEQPAINAGRHLRALLSADRRGLVAFDPA